MCMNRKKQQELQNDLEFLRERFGELDGEIQLPHSLSAEMLRYKLENIDLIAEKPKRKYPVWLKPIAGVCACFVLMLGVYQVFNSQAVKSGGALEAPAPMMVWISSINKISPGVRLVRIAAKSPAFSMAGPEVIRIFTSISLAIMPASVVFPSPGGP